MIEYNIDEVDFTIDAKRLYNGDIAYRIFAEPFIDDTVDIDGFLTLEDRHIRLHLDGYEISLCVTLAVHKEGAVTHIEVELDDDEVLLEELNDILEEGVA